MNDELILEIIASYERQLAASVVIAEEQRKLRELFLKTLHHEKLPLYKTVCETAEQFGLRKYAPQKDSGGEDQGKPLDR